MVIVWEFLICLIYVLSQGHEQDALKLMSTYLPKDGSGGSAYQEGGGLFALGEFQL